MLNPLLPCVIFVTRLLRKYQETVSLITLITLLKSFEADFKSDGNQLSLQSWFYFIMFVNQWI